MKLLEHIDLRTPHGVRRIELLAGDLAAIPPEHAVDVLVVSAYPRDYRPTSTSLIGALATRGISVGVLADWPAEDLRDDFGCWLSNVVSLAPSVGFQRILCFEPAARGNPPQVVGDVFRAIASLSGASYRIRSVATPILASGDQGYPRQAMLEKMLRAAGEWMQTALPLDVLKIVVLREGELGSLVEVVEEFKRVIGAAGGAPSAPVESDVFVSVAAPDARPADIIGRVIAVVAPELTTVSSAEFARDSGVISRIHYQALDRCRRVLVLLTPAYLRSKACQEELCIARYRSRELANPVLFPIYLHDAELPPSIRVLRMIDCREGDESALRSAAALLAIQLRGIRQFGDALRGATPAQPVLSSERIGPMLGVPVLGSARRAHDLGTPGTVSRESVLLDFMRSRFTPDELRIVLRHHGGPDLADMLPDTTTPRLVYCDRAVEALVRCGMIDEALFDRLGDERPKFRDEIAHIAEMWA